MILDFKDCFPLKIVTIEVYTLKKKKEEEQPKFSFKVVLTTRNLSKMCYIVDNA